MTEYDYSPDAYERYLATQNRIAKWVADTEHRRSEYEHAVPTKATRPRYEARKAPPHLNRPRPNLFIDPPPPDSDTSDSEDYAAIPGPMPLSAPLPYAAPVPPVGQYLLSPPMVPQTYATAPQKSYVSYRPGSHYRSPSYVQSPQHVPAYYRVAPTPQHLYPPITTGAPYPGYIVVRQQSPYQYKTMPPSMFYKHRRDPVGPLWHRP